MIRRKKSVAFLLAGIMCAGAIGVASQVYANSSKSADKSNLQHLSSYSNGTISEDGAAAEIVKYNPDNKCFYVINGIEKNVDMVKVDKDGQTSKVKTIDLSKMIPGFDFGDVTSIDINTEDKLLVMALQEEAYDKAGAVVILDYNGNLIKSVPVGVQPDMVKFSKDGSKIITANEGEPRYGYGEDVLDPKGSVSIVDLSKGVDKSTSKIVDFTSFDKASERQKLVDNKVLLKKDAKPSDDLEPEYIALSEDGKYAYISLQEANAIATLDIQKGKFTSVKGLGFKDHSKKGNEIDILKDGKIDIKSEDNFYGVYMPDSISTYEAKGKTYIVTANEGDGRDWITEDYPHIATQNQFSNLKDIVLGTNESTGKDIKVDALDQTKHDGLDEDKNYILGGRSFAIWDADTMKLVYDSQGDFEKIIADKYPEFFNCSNKNIEMDNRSGKKGPEPEDVQVGYIDKKPYAFVGIERTGGIMMYNISNPKKAKFVDYINTRDFSEDIKGDVGAEGINFVPADQSPTGKSIVLVANENSGTVSVYGVK